MTPPPTMTTSPSGRGEARTSSEVSAFSAPFAGSAAGDDPVAMSTNLPSNFSPSASTTCAESSLPRARTTFTPAAASSFSTPPRREDTMPSLRAYTALSSKVTLSADTPHSAHEAREAKRDEECSRHLVGMHPRLRQVPPTSELSTSATLMPSFAALMAPVYPAGPPPSTTRSNNTFLLETRNEP